MLPSKSDIELEFYKNTLSRVSQLSPEEILTNIVPSLFNKIDSLQKYLHNTLQNKIVCESGCSYCCYINVELTPQEVFVIIDFLFKNYDISQRKLVKDRALNNSILIANTKQEDRLTLNIKCPFLSDNDSCNIYPVRPFLCRNFHSTNLNYCKFSYENPADYEAPSGQHPNIKFVLSYATGLIHKAFVDSGFDSNIYNLSLALNEAIGNINFKRNWKKRKISFPQKIRGLNSSSSNRNKIADIDKH